MFYILSHVKLNAAQVINKNSFYLRVKFNKYKNIHEIK